MFSLKTVILFLLLFCAIQCLILAQLPPTPFPKASPNAQLCINEMNQIGVLGQCQDDAMNKWNPTKKGRESVREYCCEIFGQIDCIIDFSGSGLFCKNTKQDMVKYQKSLFNWWQNNDDCRKIKYHAELCNYEVGKLK